MKTPICDFVKKYAASETVRMHMPGHKGRGFLGAEALDITEVSGADALYEASGIIRESEQNAAELFGTQATFYGTEGSSQMIRAMLYLAGLLARQRSRITILAARNVHRSFVQACALLDYDVEWLYGQDASCLSCVITPAQLENALRQARSLPAAFYITSPDYLGKTADIRALAAVCHRYGVPLLADNAHGAYLHFLREPQHPMDLGADLCCDSAHKTLPVLTGGAYLHVAKAPEGADSGVSSMRKFFSENAKSALSLFGSTSPSYLTLQSLDHCNAVLSEGYREKLAAFIEKFTAMKKDLREAGLFIEASEPLKLTVRAGVLHTDTAEKPAGFTGNFLAAYLREHGIECEFSDPDFLVLMAGPENTEEELRKTVSVLREFCIECLRTAKKSGAGPHPLPSAERVLSIREAVFAPHEMVPVREAVGRIAGSPAVSCPPAIPIVISGERITEEHRAVFEYYGIEEAEVVLEPYAVPKKDRI